MALITKTSEISAIYPTSKWDKIDVLIAPLEKVERTKLVRILGQPLFNQIVEDYKSTLIPKPGKKEDITEPTVVEPEAPTAESMFKFDVIRTCQEIELYIMLSNNIRILTSSFNRGGGFNMLTADNYDTPDDKQMDALKKETWRNAMDSVEHLLLLLEQDAESDRVYSDLWQQSRYYYQHADLLFTTAVDMQQYMNIDESRDRFIQLLPTVRTCQEIYVATRIGGSLVKALIESQIPKSAEGVEYPDDFDVLLTYVKQALALYVESEIGMSSAEAAKVTAKGMETVRQQKNDSHLNGDRMIAIAIQQVLGNADAYAKYITKGSPLMYEYRQVNGEDYITPEEREAQAQQQAQQTQTESSSNRCSCYQQSQDEQEYDALCDLGGMHLM